MAIAVRGGIMDENRNIELADFIVERPELLRAQVGAFKPTHELDCFESEGFYRSFDLAAGLLDIRQKHPGYTDVLFRMRALLKVLSHGVVIGAGKLATEIAIPGVEQLTVFRHENVDVEALPVEMLVSSIEMPAPFWRLVFDEGTVGEDRSNVVALANHPGRVRIFGTHRFEKFYRKIMRVAVNVHGRNLLRC